MILFCPPVGSDQLPVFLGCSMVGVRGSLRVRDKSAPLFPFPPVLAASALFPVGLLPICFVRIDYITMRSNLYKSTSFASSHSSQEGVLSPLPERCGTPSSLKKPQILQLGAPRSTFILQIRILAS